MQFLHNRGNTNIKGEVGYVVGKSETNKGATKNIATGGLHLDRHSDVLDCLVWIYVDVEVTKYDSGILRA